MQDGRSLEPVYPALSTQLLDDPRRLPDPTQAIVSNSLPLWLALAWRVGDLAVMTDASFSA